MKKEIQVYCVTRSYSRRYQYVKCTMKDLKHVNAENGEYVFVTSEIMRLALRKHEES